MSTEVKIFAPKKCDFCGSPAEYDFKTNRGPWANGCKPHYIENRLYTTLGTGKGQKLILEKEL